MTSKVDTWFDPSPDDPRIVAALAAQKRLLNVPATEAAAMMDEMLAPNAVVNAPINRVVGRDSVIERVRAGQIAYEPNAVRNIEFAGVRGDHVIIMGEEVVHPTDDTPHAGRIVRRRFTDIWGESQGYWRLQARQSTIVSAE
ncbi:MAG TPA: nuclear transport factor 2 family protein [Caulobacteraceae bacterium]|jgi:hypothetical protein